MIFSIADLQSAEENFEANEGEESASADSEASYLLRYSFTITKVYTTSTLFHSSSPDKQYVAICAAMSIDAVYQEGVFDAREQVVLQGC